MALILSAEQRMLREAARGFFAKQAPLALVRELRDAGSATGQRDGIWAEIAELGWAGLILPEAHGGLDFGIVGLGLVFEEAGRTLTASPLLSSTALAGSLLAALGSEAQQAAVLPGICAGEQVAALAIDATSRHAPDVNAFAARAAGDGYLLDGARTNVIDGHLAENFLVPANLDGELAVFLVPRATRGLTVTARRQVDTRYVATLDFAAARLGADGLLGTGARAARSLARSLDIGRVCLAAELLGLATEAFERTLEYMKTRRQFDTPIGGFQALQHRAAILFGELELLRSAVLQALMALDAAAPDAARWVTLAKAKACETAQRATTEAIQLHGGIGMTDDLDIGFFLKRARVAQDALGDYGFQLQRFARLSGY